MFLRRRDGMAGEKFLQKPGVVIALKAFFGGNDLELVADPESHGFAAPFGTIEQTIRRDDKPFLAGVERDKLREFLASGCAPKPSGAVKRTCQRLGFHRG